uniref:Aldo_ket_red domain-containing protein n=1 Tax=Angiostrongylus cantonensis TaxID=6313 RepID=A0A158PAV0_ANGCA
MTVPTVKLSSGYEMPLLGLGTRRSNPGEDSRRISINKILFQMGKAVAVAVNAGYTHIDCAWLYNNQVEIGESLRNLFSSGHKVITLIVIIIIIIMIVVRENIFITSKVWNTFHSAPACKKHVVEILDQLQLEYIDLMLIHWPVAYKEGGDPFPKVCIYSTSSTYDTNDHISWLEKQIFIFEIHCLPNSQSPHQFLEIPLISLKFSRPGSDKLNHSSVDYVTTWKVLEDFVEKGKIQSIGISNFNHKQIERLITNGTIKPAVLQIELHPYLQQKKLREFCKENGIAVTAYSSLGNPGSAHFRKPGDPDILNDPIVTKIAAAHGKIASSSANQRERGCIRLPADRSRNERDQRARSWLADRRPHSSRFSKSTLPIFRGILNQTVVELKENTVLGAHISSRGSIPHMKINRLDFNNRMKVPTVKLSSGYEMPLVGLGTWQSKPGEVRQNYSLKILHASCDELSPKRIFGLRILTAVGKAVEMAINAGYTHIDCAWVYGNQIEIGETLKRLFSSGHKKNVLEILDQLQLKYVDLMLIHWPVGYEEGGGPFPKVINLSVGYSHPSGNVDNTVGIRGC